MIKKIVIRDVASYDHDGVTFDNLARVNFIYGGNGTGKTTLTRVLDNPSAYPQCSVEWEGETVSKEVKKVSDRIGRVKHRIMAEKYRFAEHIWYFYAHRAPYSVLAGSGENSKERMDFTNRLIEKVKNRDNDAKLMSFDDLWKLYAECYLNEKPNIGRREELHKALWNALAMICGKDVYFNQEMLNHLNEDLRSWEREYNETNQAYEEVVANIEGRESTLTSVQPAIDRINRMLRQSHFTGFSIQPSPVYPNYYQIQREDGSFVNDTLSEGEANFIAFLYFYQLAVGNNLDFDIGSQRVLVIDDPMSSMDSDVMMIVSTMMREIAGQGIEQMFVLTHNVEFLKQVAPRQRRNDVHYWRLVKDAGISKALDCGHDKPVRSGYELLWEEMREERDKLDSTRLQNLMRSIIETYFVKFGDYNKRKLFEGGYMATPDDRTATQAFCKWLDDGSHGPIDDLYAADPLMTNRHYMEEFKRFFALMEQGEHYSMMMRVD